ncbi:signal peptidase II [Mycolicibacterium sp. 050232]|uniref:signal peptidase II n=1 Tax=Mycolicibacterium sp. 050232 TaxID=3113982 RepID=UPI002E2E2D7A|nr:signal peptidase II [Mycolicibacterium sp. 050232]MED5815553.1 signal peptidase II [Mycolicibacterium sp. 050232]
MTDETSGPDEPVTDATEDGKSSSATAAKPRRRLRLLLTVAAVVLFVDVVTKVLAVRLLTPGQPVSIIGDTVTWTLVRNSGAAFSMATGYTWVLTLIATGVVIGIVWMGRRLVSPWWAIGLGMILGGATGNLIDRFFRAPGPLRGHVVDFFSVGWWPVFNVADPAVVGGAILLVALSLFGFDFDTVGRRRLDDPAHDKVTPEPAEDVSAEDAEADEAGDADSATESDESSAVGRQAETS